MTVFRIDDVSVSANITATPDIRIEPLQLQFTSSIRKKQAQEHNLLVDIPSLSKNKSYAPPQGRNFPAALRTRVIQVNPYLLSNHKVSKGDYLNIDLFTDAKYKAVVDKVITDVNSTVIVRARIEGFPLGSVLLSTSRGRTIGCIDIPEKEKQFIIQTIGNNGDQYLLEVDKNNDDILEDGPSPISSEFSTFDIPHSSFTPQGDPMDPATVDVMIVYSPAARQWADSNKGGIQNVIAQSIERGQLALDNSNTMLNLNLVHSEEVNYTESGDSETDLTRLSGQTDGYMDNVHVLRDQYNADLVAMFLLIEDVGGRGWLLKSISGRPDLAFCVNRVQQVSNSLTLIHEMGHNMGCAHSKLQNTEPGPGLFSYSAGWRWIGNDSVRYCSVMTYAEGKYFPDGQNHTRVAYFSNPDITHMGAQTGDSADGDNARTLREIKHVIEVIPTPWTRFRGALDGDVRSYHLTTNLFE